MLGQLGIGIGIGLGRSGLSGSVKVPDWVIAGAAVDLDVINGRYYGGSLTSELSLSRSSTGITADSTGALFSFASDTFRIKDLGIKVDPVRTNKCTNFNANPTDLTNVTKGGTAATLTVVDDSAALAAAGLSGICTSGKVYKLDNSAGAVGASATVTGSAGNLNAHTSSVFALSTAGTFFLQLSSNGSNVSSVGYQRFSLSVASLDITARSFVLIANAGAVVYFILNQLEESAFITPPIVISGATASRQADNILFTGKSAGILLGAQGWALVEIGTGSYEASAFLLGGAGASDYYLRQGSTGNTTVNGRFGGAAAATATIGASGVIGTSTIKSGITWNGSGFDIVANNGTVASLTQAPVAPAGAYLGGRNGLNVSSLHFRRITLGTGYLSTGIGAKTS